MPDPLMTSASAASAGPLFDTSGAAGDVAARSVGRRHAQILQLLQEHGPLALFELADKLSVFDHQISGRITELLTMGRIERTGDTRQKPDTGCQAHVYQLRPDTPPPDLGESLGYPDELRIQGDDGRWLRQPTTPGDGETWPGLAYSRGKGLRLTYRIALWTCPQDGEPLVYSPEAGRKIALCPKCKRRFELTTVTHEGRQHLALLLRTL